jgi:hypothetical protein
VNAAVVLALGGAAAAWLAWGVACTQGQVADVGLTEPLVVQGGQFIPGDFPSPAPGTRDAGPDAVAPLSAFDLSVNPDFLVPGLAGVGFSATTTIDAVALGVRMTDEGTGYWVVPTGIALVNNGLPSMVRGVASTGTLSRTDVPGNTSVSAVAIGSDGTVGTPTTYPVCLESRIPDNGHACSSSHPPRPVPALVFSLQWDTNFDLDLDVIVPSGLIVNPKTQTASVLVDGGAPEAGPVTNAVGLYAGTTGIIDRDSIGSCVIDGWKEEDLVFQDTPPPGLYDVYANPFDSCGQSSVRFTLTIYQPGPDGNLRSTYTQSGELLASQTTGGAVTPTGGAATGLFVHELNFE